MLPHKHALISAAIGLIGWRREKDIRAGIAALVAGVLPDLDHIVDYACFRRHGVHRLILPLHSYEYGLLGLLLARLSNSVVLQAAAWSYLAHLVADQAENRTHVLGYFLLFRAWHGFRLERVSRSPEAAAAGRVQDMHLVEALLKYCFPSTLDSGGKS